MGKYNFEKKVLTESQKEKVRKAAAKNAAAYQTTYHEASDRLSKNSQSVYSTLSDDAYDDESARRNTQDTLNAIRADEARMLVFNRMLGREESTEESAHAILQQYADSLFDTYSQFNNEDEYNQYKKLLSYDTKAAQQNIDKLTAQKQDTRWLSKDRRDINKQIDQLEDEIYRANQVQYPSKVAEYRNDPEFAKYAKQGWDIDNDVYDTFGYGTLEKNVQNKVRYAREIASKYPDTVLTHKNSTAYHLMTDEEVEVYGYLLAKYGAEEADKYIASLGETLNYRAGKNTADAYSKLGNVGEVAGMFLAGAENPVDSIAQLISPDILPTSAAAYASQIMREDLSNDGGVWQAAGDLAYSTGNMLLPMMIGGTAGGIIGGTLGTSAGALGGQLFGSAAVGLGTYGTTYNQARKEGLTERQATSYATLVSAFEGSLSFLLSGISAVGGKLTGNIVSKIVKNIDNAFLRIAISGALKAGGEGVEEGLQAVLDPIARGIATGEIDPSLFSTEEIAYSTLLGFLSGGLLEGPSNIVSNLHSRSIGREINQSDAARQQLFDAALQYKDSTNRDQRSLYDLAYEMTETNEKTGKQKVHQNDFNVGDLAIAAQDAGVDVDSIRKQARTDAAAQKAQKTPVSVSAAETEKSAEPTAKVAESGFAKSHLGIVETADGRERVSDISINEVNEDGIILDVTEEDGSVVQVAFDDVQFEDERTEELFDFARTMDTNTAKAFVTEYDGSIPVKEYAQGFMEIMGRSRNGETLEKMLASGINADVLSPAQRQAAYIAGQNAGRVVDASASAASVARGGVVDRTSGLSKAQSKHIAVVDAFAKLIRRRVIIEDSITETPAGVKLSKHVNAYFDPKTNEYHIAKDGIGQAYMFFAVHENIHDIRANNPEAYKKLKAVVFDVLGADRVAAAREVQKNLYPNENTDYIDEEIVANTVPAILRDEATAKMMAERVAKADTETRNAFEKLLNGISDLLRKAYNSLRVTASWKQLDSIDNDMDAISRIREAYFEALNLNAEIETGANKKFSINPNFAQQYAAWDGKDRNIRFYLGDTSTALKMIRVPDKKIIMDSSKIIKIKQEHPEMTDDVIVKIPQILENPIIVMKSKTDPDSITMFGEVVDKNGIPVLTVLLLKPTSSKGIALDVLKVSSAYGKDADDPKNQTKYLQNFLNTSKILYVCANKNKTDTWLKLYKLQLPSSVKYGLNQRLSLADTFVNSNMNEKVRMSVSDSDYLDAVNRGDMDTAQRMVNEAAKAAGYTVKGYHGSRTPGFTVVEDYSWLWFARDEHVAEGYGTHNPVENSRKPHNEKGVYAMYYNLGNNLNIYAMGKSWGELPVTEDEFPGVYVDDEDGAEYITTNAMAEWAEQHGYDSITFEDVDDGGYTTVDVVFNPQADAKSADPVTYDDNGNVIPLSERFNSKKEDIRFSITDSDGKQLSEGQQEYFKDSKIRDDEGNLRVMWHGTASDFTVFDINRAGANWGGNSRLGKGFYFTDNRQDALRWTEGTRAVKAYLNITNPLDVDAPAPQNIVEEIDKYIANKIATFDESGSFVSKEQYIKNLHRIKQMYMNDVAMFIDTFKYDDTGKMTDGIRDFLSSLGYDGIVSKEETVAFYPEQIKLTTNETPTSNPDIRFSLTDTESVDKTKVRSVSSLEKRLAHAKAQIKLTKGVEVNADRIKSLSRKILRQYESKYNLDTFAENLEKVFRYVANTPEPDLDYVYESLNSVSKAALLQSVTKVEDTRAAELKAYFKGKTIYISDTQKAEIESEYGSMSAFRKMLRGTGIKITTDKQYIGNSLDRNYVEMAEMFPSLFEFNTAEGDQPSALVRAFKAVEPIIENPYGMNIDEAANDLTAEILAAYGDEILAKPTFADKQKARFEEMQQKLKADIKAVRQETKAEYNKVVAAMIEMNDRNVSSLEQRVKELEQEKSDLANMVAGRIKAEERRKRAAEIDAQKAKYKEQIDKLRSKANMDLLVQQAINVENVQAVKDKMRNTEAARTLRGRIRAKVKTLHKLLLNPTDQKHIPDSMEKAVLDFCKLFTETPGVLFTERQLSRVYDQYAELSEAKGLDIASYDEDIQENLKVLRDTISGKSLSELTNDELQKINDIVDNFKHMVSKENKLFIEGRRVEIATIGEKTLDEARNKGMFKRLAILSGEKLDRFRNLVGKGNITPIYFFKQMGGQMQRLYNDIRNGQDKWAVNMTAAKEFITKTKEKFEYEKWANKKDDTLKFVTTRGDSITLTREQAMLIYATRQREIANKQQGAAHLEVGGIVFEDKQIEGKYVVDDKKAKPLSAGDISTITGWLTDQQKRYADAMVGYMSNEMSVLGNEVSLRLFGIRKFTEKYYIPYNTSEYHNFQRPGSPTDARLKHMSFTKRTVRKADTAIVVTDFTEVCAGHIQSMCMYNAMTVPLENITRVLNYKTRTDDMTTGESVRSEIASHYGDDALKYIDQLITDINGGVRSDTRGAALEYLTSLFKKGAVFMSASVAIQQPSAIGRATALVDTKYFLKSIGMKRDYETVKKYAPVAIVKQMGRFDTGTGLSATDWLMEGNEVGFEKAKKKADELGGKLPELMDQVTWSRIFNACVAETKDKTGLTGEALMEAAGKRFRDVVDYTQVYDSVLSRSANMRSKRDFAKMATSFAAEPTVSYNLLMDAVYSAKTGENGGKKYAARAVGAFVLSVTLNAALKSLVTAARDKDDDESYLEKYVSASISNFTQDINPLRLIPVVRDIMSIKDGFTIGRTDMELFDDFFKAFKKFVADDKVTWSEVSGMIGSVAAFVGIPAKNMIRDAESMVNMVRTIFDDNTPTGQGIRLAFEEGLGIDNSAKKQAERVIRAYLKGDTKEVTQTIADYRYTLSRDLTEKEANRKVESWLKAEIKRMYVDEKITPDQANELLEELVNLTDTKDLFSLYKEWNWLRDGGDSEDAPTAYTDIYNIVRNNGDITAEMKKLVDAGYEEAHVRGQIQGQIASWFKGTANDGHARISRADAKLLLQKYTDKKDSEIDKLINQWQCYVTTGIQYDDIRKEYENGKLTTSRVAEMLRLYGGYTVEDATAKARAWEFFKGNPDYDDISLEAVMKYNQYAKPVGVSVSVFADAVKFQNAAEPDYDTNGNPISKSAQKKVWAYIDKLPISKSQKDALHLSFYAKSTLRKAPWN